MAFALWRRYTAYRKELRAEFSLAIGNLLKNDLVQQLDDYKQHFRYTRLRHSIDVAYLSFYLAKLFRLDSLSVARAGLLHDLFFHTEGQHSGSLLFSHPRIALENARAICILNKVEEDIILKHMFLLTPWLPRYRESVIVTLVDKYCATKEFLVSPFLREDAHAVVPH